VIVDVKSRGDVEDQPVVAEIEAALRNRPGGRLLSAPEITAALEQANELQQRGYFVPALLPLWSATEGVLRLLAARENVELENLAPAYVMRPISDVTVDDAVRLRNQAAHGFQTSITSRDVTSVAGLARELLHELESKSGRTHVYRYISGPTGVTVPITQATLMVGAPSAS
jgi:hypothetical protein